MLVLLNLLTAKSGVSMMRFMSLICCLSAIGIAIVGLNKPVVDYSGLALLCGTFLGVAFGGKIAQKNIESKSISEPKTKA